MLATFAPALSLWQSYINVISVCSLSLFKPLHNRVGIYIYIYMILVCKKRCLGLDVWMAHNAKLILQLIKLSISNYVFTHIHVSLSYCWQKKYFLCSKLNAGLLRATNWELPAEKLTGKIDFLEQFYKNEIRHLFLDKGSALYL